MEHRRAAEALLARRDRRRLRRLSRRQPDPARRHQPAPAQGRDGHERRHQPARPYVGFAGINLRQTTAKARYNGLLVSFRHDAGRKGLVSVAYTLSRSKTDATNDRDAVDLPQDRTNLAAEYALSRTDRTHVFTVNYVYELPFFRDARAASASRSSAGGSSPASPSSGPGRPSPAWSTEHQRQPARHPREPDLRPVRESARERPRRRLLLQPRRLRAARGRPVRQHRPRHLPAPRREPVGHHASKNWYPSKNTRLQFRADFINAFNHTQFARARPATRPARRTAWWPARGSDRSPAPARRARSSWAFA